MNPSLITRTVKVVTRHSAACKPGEKDPKHNGCDCRKALRIYEGHGAGTNKYRSAKTRSWEEAEKRARELRDSWDPEKQELKKLRAAKEREQIRIANAVSIYISDMVTRLGDNGTVAMSRSMFGNVDPVTKAIKKNGHLFDYIDSFPPNERPDCISELTPAFLTAWRSSWKFGSDLTSANRWSMVKGFFKFCEDGGLIQDSPARKLKSIKISKGNRTAIFTDDQYADILGAISLYDPQNVPEATRKGWQQRLKTFVELLRWSGMSLVDAVQFRSELVGVNGAIKYRRQKTGELATVPLPDRLLTLLRNIPLERDTIDATQPFRTNAAVSSDTATWSRRLQHLFTLAGILEVRTENGKTRKPHAHMLRDTFAVGKLSHGASVHTVSKLAGHSNTKTTERSYLPSCEELEKATLADSRKALTAELQSASLAENRKALAEGLPKPLECSNVIAMRTKR